MDVMILIFVYVHSQQTYITSFDPNWFEFDVCCAFDDAIEFNHSAYTITIYTVGLKGHSNVWMDGCMEKMYYDRRNTHTAQSHFI